MSDQRDDEASPAGNDSPGLAALDIGPLSLTAPYRDEGLTFGAIEDLPTVIVTIGTDFPTSTIRGT